MGKIAKSPAKSLWVKYLGLGGQMDKMALEPFLETKTWAMQ